MILAYDGSDFHGWQVQPGLRTVQGVLSASLKRLLPLEGFPPGAGRTDAGVHARGQVSSVALPNSALLARLERALPRMLPDDVSLVQIDLMPPDFHARFSARGRRYSYRILRGRDPFRRRNHWMLGGELDVERMRQASEQLLGEHDYSSFCVSASVEEGKTRCHVRDARWQVEGDELVFQIAADRFLHSMVRSIVGTLVEVGRGSRAPDSIVDILGARHRSAAGLTAPPQGLSLDFVEYPDHPS